MKQIRLISGVLTVGFWTLLSRVFGFARDIMIAAYLGSGPVAEAFLIAFSLPNMFRRFFAEGAFNMAFVPMFSKKLEASDDAHGFAKDAFSGLAALLIVFSIFAIFAMPYLVLLMAGGFAADERFDLAVSLGRIAFPYILFISLAALLSGLLNATGRFVAAAAAPVLLNIFFVIAMLVGDFAGWDMGRTLAWTVPIAGIAQVAVVWIAARRAGFTLVPRKPVLTPDLKRLAIIAAPAALSGGVMQINLLVGRQVASFFDGAIAWLNYADRLYQLPLGVVAIAIGVVLLPDLSRKLQADDMEGSKHAFNRAAEIALALTIPAAVALVVIPAPLINVMFERGQFGPDDTASTALAVAVYGLGLPAFVMQKVLQPLFYAREDTKRPFKYALVAMVINAGLAIGLSYYIGYIAAAVGTTLSAWVMMALLIQGSRNMGDAAAFDTRLKSRLWRIVLSSAVMGVALWAFALVLGPSLSMAGVKYISLAALIGVGIGIYFVTAHLTGALRLSELKSNMRR